MPRECVPYLVMVKNILISSSAYVVITIGIFLELSLICSTFTVTNITLWEIPNTNSSEPFKFTSNVISDYNFSGHLEIPVIKQICASNRSVCDLADDNFSVCAVRFVKGTKEERGFKNWCYLFLCNMCDTPGQEYHITYPDLCEKYHSYRRKGEPNNTRPGNLTDTMNFNVAGNHMNNTNNNISNTNEDIRSGIGGATSRQSNKTRVIKKRKLRNGADTDTRYAKKYEIDESFDFSEGHVCPHSCPEHYKPVCLNVNQGGGAKMRFYTFVNHCKMDLYYCRHHKDFKLEGNEEDDLDELQYSQLGWTHCASTRYTQFARFAESVSSMGHFGWLAGDYKYSHIMEPHQKMPGFGKK